MMRVCASSLMLLCAASLAASAQPAQKVHRIGFIASTSSISEMRTVNPATRAFVQGLRELGYVEGSNLVIEWRTAEGKFERFHQIAAELVSIKVDIIVTVMNPMTKAAKEVTQTVPIVMGASTNPVEQGLIESLSRPGGNVTGLSLDAGPEIVGKRLQLIKELVPAASRVVVLGAKLEGLDERATQLVGRTMGMSLLFVEPDAAQQYATVFASIARERPDALLVAAAAANYAQRHRIVEFASRNNLPVMYPARDFAEAGGLVSYGWDLGELYRRRVADYVDRILRGARPAELPVERPIKFELVLNRKTAKALALNIPSSLLLQADALIE